MSRILPSWSAARDVAPRRLGKKRKDAAAGNHDHLLDFDGTFFEFLSSTTKTAVYTVAIPPGSWRPEHATRIIVLGGITQYTGGGRTLRLETEITDPASVTSTIFDYTTPSLPLAADLVRQFYHEVVIFHHIGSGLSRTSTATMEIGEPESVGLPGGLVSVYTRQHQIGWNQDPEVTLTLTVSITFGAGAGTYGFERYTALVENI